MPTERETQRAIVDLCQQLGGTVFSLSQGYRPGGRRHGTTRQTKGLPDLYVFFPAKRKALWIEVKGPKGKPTVEQRHFGTLAAACDVPHVIGGVDEVIRALSDLGFIFPSGTSETTRTFAPIIVGANG